MTSPPINIDDLNNEGSHYNVMLPCEPQKFTEFISGLLGKPQTIEKSIDGCFEIDKEGIKNTYFLIDQRITKQNKASLVQFIVKIRYDDNTSITLNSFSDFETYTEIRPLVSIGVVFSWTYLIKFEDKDIPEKQEISVSLRGGKERGIIVEDGEIIGIGNSISIRIRHTERTWGSDIEALLTGHLNRFLKKDSRIRLFVRKHSGSIGLTTSIFCFLIAVFAGLYAFSKFTNSYSDKIKALTTPSLLDTLAQLNEKTDFLVDIIARGAWYHFTFSLLGFLLISLIISIVIGLIVSSQAETKPTSHIVLSSEAETLRDKENVKFKRDWLMFILSIPTGILIKVVSSAVFLRYFSQ